MKKALFSILGAFLLLWITQASPPLAPDLRYDDQDQTNATAGIAISAGTANTTHFLNYETDATGNQSGDPAEYHASWLSGKVAHQLYQAIPTDVTGIAIYAGKPNAAAGIAHPAGSLF